MLEEWEGQRKDPKKETVKPGGESDMTAVCENLFQGFLQKAEHSGVGGCGKDHCHQNKCVLL